MYLVDALDHEYQSGITYGVVRASRKMNADLVILVGGRMVYVNKHLEKRNFIYNLANPKDFDGVVLLGTSLSSQEGLSAIAPLIVRFSNLPAVSIGLDIGKGATVLVDNAEGMKKIANHLLDIHRYKSFAYISGPEKNKEAQIRLKTFKESLAKRQIILSSELVVEGAFTEESGEKALQILLDERKMNIASLDAIVAANDSMAVGAMNELKRRGYNVPLDVAIVGFDDIESARYADTPLTTIQQPLIMQGERAVEEILLSQFYIESKTIEVSPKLVVRRSCGCGGTLDSPTLSTTPPINSAETLAMILSRKRETIENDLAVAAERGGIARGWEVSFLDAVIDAVAGKGYKQVTDTVARLVHKSIETGEGVNVWATSIASLDKHLSKLVSSSTEEGIRVETLLHRARTAMSEATEYFHAGKVRELRNRTFAFNEAAIAMLSTLDERSLSDAIATHLPKLGINNCSIALFENGNSYLRRILVMNECRRLENNDLFDATLMVAPEIVENRAHALVVEPLCFYEDIYGVAALEYGPSEGGVYEQLGAFLSASVKAIYISKSGSIGRTSILKHDTANHIDSLTGVYSRHHLPYRFADLIAVAKESSEPLSLIILDMDDFDKLNLALGKDQGDKALVGVAKTLKNTLKATNIVARLEEDKFAILMPNTSFEQAKTAAELIKRRLKLALAFEFHGHIAASMGITTSTHPHNTDGKTLLEEALRALVSAKRFGKDCAVHTQDIPV